MKQSVKVIILIAVVLFLDQALKIWVKTNMAIGQEFEILGQPWALIHFVENNGMAFGFSLGGSWGKLALSVFRIIAVGFLAYYIRFLLKSKVSFGLLASFALIFSGALGNILDSAFYGVLFSASNYHGGVAEFLPEGGGYANFLYGKVVDMFYFPMFSGTFPDWMPFWGGEPYLFFRPVFNVADAAITVGVMNIILFQRSFFSGEEDDNQTTSKQEAAEEESLESYESIKKEELDEQIFPTDESRVPDGKMGLPDFGDQHK